MIVADASVLVSSVLGRESAQRLLEEEQIQVPSDVDVEVAQALRKHVQLGCLAVDDGRRALETYRWMAVTRHSTFGFFDRIWELRDNLTAYDAAYVASAEIIDCPLVTADGRISRAPGLRCAITILPE